MSERQNPFAQGFNSNAENERMEQAFGKNFFVQPKPLRSRNYEKKNPATSYPILIDDRVRAEAVEEALKAIAEILGDRTTVSDVARLLVRYAITEYGKDLDLVPTQSGKAALIVRKKEQGWEKPPVIELKSVRKKKTKSQETPQKFLAYRWGDDSKIDADIKALANPVSEHPRRYEVSPGRVLVRLLELGIHDYIHQKIELTPQVKQVEQKVTTWSKR